MEPEKEKKVTSLFRPKFGISATFDEQNNKEAVIKNNVSEVDYSTLKVFGFIFNVIIVALLFSYSLIFWPTIYIVLLGLFFVSIISLTPLFLKSYGLYFLIAIATSVALIAPLFILRDLPMIFSIIIVGLSTILFIKGLIISKSILDNSLRIRFNGFTKHVINSAIIVVALIISTSYGWNFKIDTLFSDKILNNIMSLSSPVFIYYVPNFSSDMLLTEFIEILVRRSMDNDITPSLIDASEEIKNQTINEVVYKTYQEIESDLAVDLNFNASVQDNFNFIMRDRFLEQIKAINPDHLSIVIILVLFIIINIILRFFTWLIIFIAFLIYQLLLIIKIAEIHLETRTREIVVLK